MNSRDRLLAAIHNEKPDHLPAQVHGWMGYYLQRYLGGIDQWAAYKRFDLDPVIYTGPRHVVDEKASAGWIAERGPVAVGADGVRTWRTVFHTPDGDLTLTQAANEITTWDTEHLIRSERDWGIWDRWIPVPTYDWTPVREAKDRLGDGGIVRTGGGGYGQGSPWQDLCTMMGTVPAIMIAMDEPARMHHMLERILAKRLETIEKSGTNPSDIVECGGGAGSDTVISPALHREFCTPYDQRQHGAIHEKSPRIRIVYHLCGGLMHMLDNVAANGADGIETMTPPSMGGNCDLAAATRQVGDRLFFIGGFDQNAGFENGTPAEARRLVFELHTACPHGGYIVCPSDHFFHGDPACLQAFADAAKECKYD